jgi:hypothetical protein
MELQAMIHIQVFTEVNSSRFNIGNATGGILRLELDCSYRRVCSRKLFLQVSFWEPADTRASLGPADEEM